MTGKNLIRQKGSFLHAFEPFDKKKYLIGGYDLNPASGGPATVLFTRSLGALRAPTSSWGPFGPLDFVLRALRALRPCDPRSFSQEGRHHHIFTITHSTSPIHHNLFTIIYFTITYSPSPIHHHLFTITYSPSHIHHRLFTITYSPLHIHHHVFTTTYSPIHLSCQSSHIHHWPAGGRE